MKVLYLHSNQPDYLAESLFHGLRQFLGADCVDIPRYDSMYRPLTDRMKDKTRGHGFTLYGLLDDLIDLSATRYFWENEIEGYGLIVIASIWQQWQLVGELLKRVPSDRLVVLDGKDTSNCFPFSGALNGKPHAYFTSVSKLRYFKREWLDNGAHLGKIANMLPRFARSRIRMSANIRPISFSIPAEKIWYDDRKARVHDFPKDIVDPEVAAYAQSKVTLVGRTAYPFYDEEAYYSDLRQARFGVTMKRAGWDCLRHYELAANGCVLCFRDLHLKPSTCAPHGLNESNSISYSDLDELLFKTTSLTEHQYRQLQKNSFAWIEQNTTIARAKQFIEACS